MALFADYHRRIIDDGYAIVEGVLPKDDVERLRTAIRTIPRSDAVRKRANTYGVRNLLEISEPVRLLAASPAIRALAAPVLGRACFAVRATFFDKVPDANWNLRYHQDGVISVREQIETPGFGAWANKAGTLQVRPPESVLQQMLAIRVHLDDCPRTNGALRVLAGSHSRQWPREQIESCKQRFEEAICEVGVGGVLAMRPLLLHASSAAESPGHRRVVHIEYACTDLPGDLEWKQRVW